MEKVDARESGIIALELLLVEREGNIVDAIGRCVVAGAGAGLAYAAIVGITAPEPIVSKVLGGMAAGGSGIVCGGKIISAWRVDALKQEILEEAIVDASREAVFEFQGLQQDLP